MKNSSHALFAAMFGSLMKEIMHLPRSQVLRSLLVAALLLTSIAAPQAVAGGWLDGLCAFIFRDSAPDSALLPGDTEFSVSKPTVTEFIARLRATGLKGVTVKHGRPVILRSTGSFELSVFDGPVAADFVPLFRYPETLISSSWDVARHLDSAVTHGKNIHFNLQDMNVEQSVDAYRTAIQTGRTTARSTDWELGRVVHGILEGYYPPDQVVFWDGEQRLGLPEVASLLERFRSARHEASPAPR